MAEEQENKDAAQPATPPREGGQAHAGTLAGAPAPLGEWRGPAFWMACGALLAGVAVGAVMLVQRVSVERDMMAVAATLPQAGAAPAAPAAPPAPAPVQQPVPAPVPARPPAAIAVASASHVTHPHKAKAKARAASHHKLARERAEYAEVFKRCPALGQRGALECRHHICNGAERQGPACKPYRGRLP